ncbi:hypothetical protein C8Q72DRAFT_884687 [Fomitopsis betulina]|nr:hypothetical protein C8Q72DRAFT_884687 [Fomitopsis betulina]
MAAPNEPTPASLAIHTPDGTVWTQWDTDIRRHVALCDICSKKIVLTKHGHSHAFLEHRQSRTCLEQEQKAQRRREREAADATRRELFHVQSATQSIEGRQLNDRNNTPVCRNWYSGCHRKPISFYSSTRI